MFLVTGTARDGTRYFYTGKAGSEWVVLATDNNRELAFTYGREGAERKAAIFNQVTALHGLTFEAEAA